jgi:Lipocalin-like domain
MKQLFGKTIISTLFSMIVLTSCQTTPEPLDVLTGSSQATWVITSRIENGGAPSLPDCAKDDSLIFKKDGKFDSLIAGTQCNPAETDVKDGTFALSEDKKVITFTVPGFSYTGKLLELAQDQIVIEFDLGSGFIIQDTLSLKP